MGQLFHNFFFSLFVEYMTKLTPRQRIKIKTRLCLKIIFSLFFFDLTVFHIYPLIVFFFFFLKSKFFVFETKQYRWGGGKTNTKN